MDRRPWYRRLLCFLGLHRWHYARESRRTCARCGLWQRWHEEESPSGFASGSGWRDF
jgi:hypothetical protein